MNNNYTIKKEEISYLADKITANLLNETKSSLTNAVQTNPNLARELNSYSPEKLENFVETTVSGTAIVSAATGYNPQTGPLVLDTPEVERIFRAGFDLGATPKNQISKIRIFKDESGNLVIEWNEN